MAGAVGLCAGPRPIDSAAGPAGADGIIFDVAKEGLEAGGVEVLGVIPGGRLC